MESTETSNFESFDTHQEKPNNSMALAIISAVLGCCFSPCYLPGLVLGILAIVNSSKVNKEFDMGNYAEAEKAAKNAKTFSYIALGLAALGLLINVVWYASNPDGYLEQIEQIQRQIEDAQGA